MKTRTKLISQAALALLALAAAAHAQLIVPTNRPVVGARMPALSPDGQRLTFVYRGDLWSVEADGGRARPLTSHPELDSAPVYSPDGQWIAFSSRRNGGADIFAMPADGGVPQQLTFHAEAETPSGWSPDSQQIIFAAKRESANYGIYTLDVKTLRTCRLTEDYAPLYNPRFSCDGRRVVYDRYGFPASRPRYYGSAASQIWLLDLTNHVRRALVADQRQHLWSQFLPDSQHVLTVTCMETTPSSSGISEGTPPMADNPLRTPNLWSFDLHGKGRQLTKFTGGATRWPSAAAKSGDIAFEYSGDLYLLKHGQPEPQKLAITVATDDRGVARRSKMTNGVTEAEPSPDAKSFAFGLKGDIWTVATDKPKGPLSKSAEYARRLTDWVGEDNDFMWSRDGKKLYFVSDRDLYARIYELDLATKKVKSIWARNDDVSRVQLSPDGNFLGFWQSGAEGGLYTYCLTNGESKRVVAAPGPHWNGRIGGDFAWSPDLQWIAYAIRKGDSVNLWIAPAQGGESRNITRLHAVHSEPAWSPDGKFLFFGSNRDGSGLYVVPLRKEEVRLADTELKFEKPTNAVTVAIDFDGIPRRIRKVNSQMPAADLTIAPTGTLYFISDGDVWSCPFDGKDPKKLTTGAGKSGLRVNKDATKAYYLANGEMTALGLGSGGKEEKVTFIAESLRDTRAERLAAFTQFWRSYQRGFYDAAMHGRDWDKIRRKYEPLLDAVETNDEFAALLTQMVGELEASHSEVNPENRAAGTVTPHLGFTFDYSHPGPGLRVARVPDGSPASFPKTAIKPGEYVLAINGTDVKLDEKLYDLLNDRQDREFEFLVSADPTDRKDARRVKYKPLAQDEWNDLQYRNRVERLRQTTERQSDGKVGYLHISAMAQPNQVKFDREFWEYCQGKDAMIIDVRFNSGGNISDNLIDMLERRPNGYLRSRGGPKETTPNENWAKRIVVLMNEHSYSNGELFPAAIRARNLGTLVGNATPGYVIWTTDNRLLDGTRARMPFMGAYRLDGSNLENNGEHPDVSVWLSPDDWLTNRDPQLEKALEILGVGTSSAEEKD